METIEQSTEQIAKPTAKPTACPICASLLSLSYMRSSDGRGWVNCACPPCGYAMNENDQWTFFSGGITRVG